VIHNLHQIFVRRAVSSQPFLTVAEVAQLLRVRPRSVYDAVAKGVLPAGRFGKHLRFRRADIDAFTSRAFSQQQ